jgi:hypothetical protein
MNGEGKYFDINKNMFSSYSFSRKEEEDQD